MFFFIDYFKHVMRHTCLRQWMSPVVELVPVWGEGQLPGLILGHHIGASTADKGDAKCKNAQVIPVPRYLWQSQRSIKHRNSV